MKCREMPNRHLNLSAQNNTPGQVDWIEGCRLRLTHFPTFYQASFLSPQFYYSQPSIEDCGLGFSLTPTVKIADANLVEEPLQIGHYEISVCQQRRWVWDLFQIEWHYSCYAVMEYRKHQPLFPAQCVLCYSTLASLKHPIFSFSSSNTTQFFTLIPFIIFWPTDTGYLCISSIASW